MAEETTNSGQSLNSRLVQHDYDRSAVIDLLRMAFERAAKHDYALGYIINEEDVRASVYRYVRNDLERSPLWRIFTSATASSMADGEDRSFKPDLALFYSNDPQHSSVALEILVEVKHWPREEQIRRDINKLVALAKSHPNHPDTVFFAIVGSGGARLQKKLGEEFKQTRICLESHLRDDGTELYTCPWNPETRLNPWQKCLRLR